jgi:hypothetical protein
MLPSGLREKMDNNPAKFMDYVKKATPEQLKELGFHPNVHDGKTNLGAATGRPTDQNNDGRIDTIDTNNDGVADSNPKPTPQ